MKIDLLYAAMSALLAGTALLPVTLPQGARAAQSPFAVDMGPTGLDGLNMPGRAAGISPTHPVLPRHGVPSLSHPADGSHAVLVGVHVPNRTGA